MRALHLVTQGNCPFLTYHEDMTDETAEESRRLLAKTEKTLPDFIGLRVEAAIELAQRLNLELRVIRIHENEWHTSELRMNRITAEVEDGVVTSARAE